MRHFQRSSLTAVAAILAAVSVRAAAPSTDIPANVDAVAKAEITASALRAPVRFLASDELEGRGPATRGDALARLYLSAQLETLGYQPGGDNGGWEQAVEVVGVTAKLPATWNFTGKGGDFALKWSDDYIAGSGVQEPIAEIKDAGLVFVGYGIEAPEYKWDDFKGVDVRGKVLVMLNNDPDWDPKLFEGVKRLYYGRWTYKYEVAARHGAAGVIIVHTTPSAGYPWQVVQSSWGGEQFELPAENEPRIQLKGWATEDAARRLLEAGGADLDKLVAAAKKRNFKPVPIALKTSIKFENTVSRVRTANVVGVLPGSDPKLKEEVVIYTAHHDHFGIGEPDETGDKIYNGAEDNASGCAQLLAIARAFAALPERPRRSIMMLFVAGEEQGLLGSKYYAEHPTFAPGKIAANINYDGGNYRGRTKDLTQLGMGKSSLDGIAKALVEKQGRVLVPDQFPDKGYFYRSDQFNFAKIGVPALYFDNGYDYIGKPPGWGKKEHEEWTEHVYHQPSDELDDTWVWDGMIEDSIIGFQVGWLVAQADQLPTWNPGDEFEAARKKALGN
ncbi:MAG TPA: M28 family peptidase [Steroidobacteraceae bacterium]|jgi:Zn-dependent M28 family amino/carboxypeptidase|nr:M28 family peptidase [Steroidobacteraceae bacterium]